MGWFYYEFEATHQQDNDPSLHCPSICLSACPWIYRNGVISALHYGRVLANCLPAFILLFLYKVVHKSFVFFFAGYFVGRSIQPGCFRGFVLGADVFILLQSPRKEGKTAFANRIDDVGSVRSFHVL